jgi:hypothetical protein
MYPHELHTTADGKQAKRKTQLQAAPTSAGLENGSVLLAARLGGGHSPLN